MSVDHVNVAIFGSCVSRDMCEFWPQANVAAYVARQSAMTRLAPVGPKQYPTDQLTSNFQARMYRDDKSGNAVNTLVAANPSVLLVDLVDERRGVWMFPNGRLLTNSVEAFRTGVDRWAPEAGARLLELGTDEHFYLWRTGFEQTIRAFRRRMKTRVPIVFIDVDWAEALDGQPLARGVRSVVGSAVRRTQRQFGRLSSAFERGKSPAQAFSEFFDASPTAVEEFAARARKANAQYRRYADEAAGYVDLVVRRSVDEMRMNPDHKWGPEPFHYRDSDYLGLIEEIEHRLAE